MRCVALLVVALVLGGCSSAAKDYEVGRLKLVEMEERLEVLKAEHKRLGIAVSELVSKAQSGVESQRIYEENSGPSRAKFDEIRKLQSEIEEHKKLVKVLGIKAGAP